MSQDYACDVLLEPIVWVVDNFTDFLGPVSIWIQRQQSINSYFKPKKKRLVFRMCGSGINISNCCDSSLGRFVILVATKSIIHNWTDHHWILVADQCHIPLFHGCFYIAWFPSRCKLLLISQPNNK